MNRTSILKGLAICSSVLLAGGFVVYRQKQAADPSNDEVPILPSSKSKQVVFPSSKNIDAVLSNPGQQRTSGDFDIPADPDSHVTPTDPDPPERETGAPEKPGTKTLLPSSKSIDSILLKPSQQKTSPVPPKPGSPEGNGKVDITVLPGSKVGAILKPEDVPVEKEAPAADSREKEKP